MGFSALFSLPSNTLAASASPLFTHLKENLSENQQLGESIIREEKAYR